ncbi:MAG: 16S rRNA (adenine(1518)-N(6)/adenine(1519)-N(6))-dimethyltransferase RsmA [Firmicutes bacterium]|nr:16S rRNA (adenine(1518)-N(6)/adenine(1519)-N(6))-dimethyltransferase RsmA [Bacillota bacterium]
MKLYQPSTVNELRNRYGFKITKSLGQNFLTDKHIIDQIIDSADIQPDDLVIEIGPGLGVITYEAAQKAKRVIAIEIDKNLLPILHETLGELEHVTVLNQDILKSDVNEIITAVKEQEHIGGVKIIGNLPYYITTPIVMKLLEEGVDADSITVMMQKEVAERIQSSPGKKTYGAISVAVQYYCQVEMVAKVPRDVFIPQPNVDSAVLRLLLRKEKPVELLDEAMFFACIRAGFGQRRKTLLNSLTGVKGMTKGLAEEALSEAKIEPTRRGETLDLEEFAALSNAVTRRL